MKYKIKPDTYNIFHYLDRNHILIEKNRIMFDHTNKGFRAVYYLDKYYDVEFLNPGPYDVIIKDEESQLWGFNIDQLISEKEDHDNQFSSKMEEFLK